jgi:hypothetical protein
MKIRPRPLFPTPDDDDGRTISPMNVDGMPWHTRSPEPAPGNGPKAEPPKGKSLRRYMVSAVGAGLLITLLFGGAGALFILFCTRVWFR